MKDIEKCRECVAARKKKVPNLRQPCEECCASCEYVIKDHGYCMIRETCHQGK